MTKLILAGPIRLVIFLLLTVFVSGCMTPQELEAARAGKVTTVANTESNRLYDISYAQSAPSCESGAPCFDDIADDPCKIFSSQEYCEQYGPLVRAKAKAETDDYGELVRSVTALTPLDQMNGSIIRVQPSAREKVRAAFDKFFAKDGSGTSAPLLQSTGPYSDKLKTYCWKPVEFEIDGNPTASFHFGVAVLLMRTKFASTCETEFNENDLSGKISLEKFKPTRSDRLVIIRELNASSENYIDCPQDAPLEIMLSACDAIADPINTFNQRISAAYFTTQCIQQGTETERVFHGDDASTNAGCEEILLGVQSELRERIKNAPNLDTSAPDAYNVGM